MYNVSVPAQVSLLFRRCCHILSALSISEQYLQTKSLPERPHTPTSWLLNGSSSPTQTWSWPSILRASVQSSSDMGQSSNDQPQYAPSNPPEPPQPEPQPKPPVVSPHSGIIHQLMNNPALRDPLRTPRYPIVLSHGLFGFDVRGPTTFPSLRMHYWSNVLSILRDTLKAEVIVTSVPGTGTIVSRSEEMDRQLQSRVRGRGINILAHSMGGLDSRHLITHLKPTTYTPLSLTSVCTPHRGSPFMDWCADNVGIGKLKQREELLSKSAPDVPPASPTKSDTPFTLSLSALPSSFTTLLLSIVDSPAYSNLTTTYLNEVFNPLTPNDPKVKYFSVAGRIPTVGVWHPFWLPKLVLDNYEERHRDRLRSAWIESGSHEFASGEKPLWAREDEWGNDGLVSVSSAKWGEFMGIVEGADHWEMRGARGIQLGMDKPLITTGNNWVSEFGDGWGLKDWSRFVGAWKKEEKIRKDAVDDAKAKLDATSGKGKEENEALTSARLSVDKLSSVFDWLVAQIPTPPLLASKAKVVSDVEARTRNGEPADTSEMKKHMDNVGNTAERKKNQLASKADLERFYLALSRKMYDEGL